MKPNCVERIWRTIIMKLLLVEDVEMLGWLGDTVDVKSGYARLEFEQKEQLVASMDGTTRAILKTSAHMTLR